MKGNGLFYAGGQTRQSSRCLSIVIYGSGKQLDASPIAIISSKALRTSCCSRQPWVPNFN